MIARHVHGPFRHGRKWRVVYRDGRRQRYLSFDARTEAVKARESMLGEHDLAMLARVTAAVEMPADPVWIYMLHDECDRVVYVGSTRNLDGRLADHRENGVPFKRMTFFPEVHDREVGLSIEAALIRKHDPALNKSGRMETLWKHGHLEERGRQIK